MPAGLVGVAYSAPLASVGGLGSLSWSLASGALPAGLALTADGKIEGTPTEAGRFEVTVALADSGPPGQVTIRQLTLTIGGLRELP